MSRFLSHSLIAVGATAGLLACDSSDRPMAAALPQAASHAPVLTSQPAQARLAAGVRGDLTPILSVGDTLPDGSLWAPIPDGLGAYADWRKLVLFVNHELNSGGVKDQSGAAQFNFARVSRLELDRRTLAVRDASYVVDGSEQYLRLCSATFVGYEEGFPSGYFLTGEEQTGGVHDGIQLAIGKDGTVHELPWMGRFAHENAVAVPYRHKVALFGTDDTAGKSELYLYVGDTEADVINGAGKLYVFVSSGAAHAGNLTAGQEITGGWVEVPNPASLSSAALQTAVRGLGAFPFVRLEDADYDHRHEPSRPALYFVDTGSQSVLCNGTPCDPYGSIYRLGLDRRDPAGPAKLTLLARSSGAQSGWSSPDNIAAGERSLMVQEDPANATFAGQRAPQIWQFDLTHRGGITQGRVVVELENDTCNDVAGTCWESSGIIDASEWLGQGSWLFDIQAHTLPVPNAGLVNEGGQLLLLRIKGS
jgi:hypothetical protein